MLRKAVSLLCMAGLAAALHAAFIIHGCGEQDEARLINGAAVWHQSGVPVTGDYTIRVSPLYLHGLKKCLDWGVSLRAIPSVMNWLNILFASALLVPLFLLWEGLTGRGIAAGAVGLFLGMPAFWCSSIYGMPHIPSFALFLLCLVLFLRWVMRPDRQPFLFLAGAVVCMTLALLLKADMVLCSGALLGILVVTNRLSVRNAVWALGIPCIGFLATLLYTRAVAAPPQSVAGFAVGWHRRFPLTLAVLKDQRELAVLVHTTGRMLLLAIGWAATYCICARKRRGLLAFALLWAAPAVLFWALREGNSARHMMAPFCPLLALVSVFVFDAVKSPKWAAAVLMLLLTQNYFAHPSSASTVTPSSRIFESVAKIQHAVSREQGIGEECYKRRGDRKLLVAPPWAVPYIVYELLCRAKDFTVLDAEGVDWLLRITDEDGREQLIRTAPPPGKTAQTMLNEGWKGCYWRPES